MREPASSAPEIGRPTFLCCNIPTCRPRVTNDEAEHARQDFERALHSPSRSHKCRQAESHHARIIHKSVHLARNQSGRSVSARFHRGLLTPQIAEVDARLDRTECEREQISFDFAKLLTAREALARKPAHAGLLRVDDPASFERPLRVGNLLFELWTRAMLAAPSPRRSHQAQSRFDRPAVESARKRGSMTSFQTAG